MRMWMVDPRLMCRQHLLGEHVELHILAANIRDEKGISGFLNGLVMPQLIKSRHDELAEELLRRGYNHTSPLEQPVVQPSQVGKVDPTISLLTLRKRCPACRERQDFLGSTL